MSKNPKRAPGLSKDGGNGGRANKDAHFEREGGRMTSSHLPQATPRNDPNSGEAGRRTSKTVRPCACTSGPLFEAGY